MKYVIFRGDGTASGPFINLDGHDGFAVEVPDDFSWDTYRPDFETQTVTPDPTPVRVTKKAQLATYRDEVVLATVETSIGTFFCDDKTKLLMAGRVLGILVAERAGIAPPATVRFKTTTGYQEFDREPFMMAALEVLSDIASAFETTAALETTIDGLDDPAAIEAVTWPT